MLNEKNRDIWGKNLTPKFPQMGNCYPPNLKNQKSEILEGKMNLLKIPEGYRYGILPVIYSDIRYDVTSAVFKRNKNLLLNPYYYKSSHWEYEQEWRMVITEDAVTDGEYYADFANGISGIYLGLKSYECNKEKNNRIVEKYSNRGIPVYKIVIEPSSYRLKSIQIN